MSDHVITVPHSALVVMVGASGSGKSTFARRHFAPTQVVSSDHCRALVADDENDLSATRDAFAVLHHLVAARLRRGRLTVVDATSVRPRDRKPLIAFARTYGVPAVAVVLDVPESVARVRARERPDRDLPGYALSRQRRALRDGLPGMDREGFERIHVLYGQQIDAAMLRFEDTPGR